MVFDAVYIHSNTGPVLVQIAHGYDAMVAEYVSAKVGGAEFTPGLYVGFAIFDDIGEFCAGVVISNFRGTDCEISIAGETALAWRTNICVYVFNYIFNTAGCVRCTSITTKRNVKARRFLDGMGFQLEGNLRLGYDGRRDALIYGLLAKDCRFLRGGAGGIDGSGSTDIAERHRISGV